MIRHPNHSLPYSYFLLPIRPDPLSIPTPLYYSTPSLPPSTDVLSTSLFIHPSPSYLYWFTFSLGRNGSSGRDSPRYTNNLFVGEGVLFVVLPLLYFLIKNFGDELQSPPHYFKLTDLRPTRKTH